MEQSDHQEISSEFVEKQTNPKNCRYTSEKPNLWDRFTYGHLTRIIFKGSWAQITAQDLQPLHTTYTAKHASSRIIDRCKSRHVPPSRGGDADDAVLIPNEDSSRLPNLMGVICKAFWGDFLKAFLLSAITLFVTLVPPFLIGKLDDFLSDANQPDKVGYYIAGVLILSQQLISIANAHTYGILYDLGIKCRSGLASAIYQKCLRLSSKATKEFPSGDIVNIISVDLENVMWWIVLSTTLLTSPLLIILTFYMLFQYLGVYCLAGAIVIVAFSPIMVGTTWLESKLQAKHMKKKDERVEMVTEVLNNIKVLKLYAWENSFMQKIRKLRTQETHLMYLYLLALNMFSFVWCCCPFLVSASAIAAYMFLDKKSVLEPKVVLVSIAYFNSLRSALTNFPYAVSRTARVIVSLRRIKKFLEADEIDSTTIKEDLQPDEEISLKNASFSWSDEGSPVLQNLDLSVQKGELVAVVGPVAAGKSSLIQAIIGEMSLTNGSIHRHRSSKIAYVPQQAWILNSTIKNNILFGAQSKPKFYREVVKKSCLLPDLKILAAGDSTEIGEKGINLSGGQKQRISIARAVYQDTDIYLLDDPLSAVDAHVAQRLFSEIIGPNGLLKDKTRVLVTHSVAFLPYVDRIIVLDNGRVIQQGTYDEIMRENTSLKKLIETHANTESEHEDQVIEPPCQSETTVFRRRAGSGISLGSNESGHLERQISELGRFIEDEEMEEGGVRWSVYLEFFRRFGIFGILLTLSGYTVFRLADTGSLYYITEYSNELGEKNSTTTEDMWAHMQMYLAFGGVQVVSCVVGLFSLSLGCVWTSTSLHNKMLDAVMKAPMSFFDSTPTGRILNRFSRDVDELDLSLYSVWDGYLETLVAFIVCLTLICIKIPAFLSILVPLIVLFLLVQQFYMSASRQWKRLNATTKSPVLNSFNETLAGTTSIRAYAAGKEFIAKHMGMLDNNQNCMYHEYTGYRWLAIRLNLIGDLICFAICCVITYTRNQLPGWMGTLLFSFSLQGCDALTWIVRLGAQVENSLVSAERVLEYSKTKSEAPWYLKNDVKPEWPSRGEVQFQNYSTRYREHLDLVLKKINLQIFPCEKVGIVGRTGAGKSSLTIALLRVIEAAEGKILIDGVDISKVGLQNLRSRISMIPQDPVLFAGTLRENIDPEERYSDEEVWTALEKAHLKSEEKPITFKIDEGGSNLSVGERQLVCLARALLKNARLLILDEATAAVDLETDAVIQKTIREDFKSCTVITIAHRLHTILDYDKIVVLDHGEVREVGSPKELLTNIGGIFYSMAQDANIRIDSVQSEPQA